jgi:hypothetical protein
MTGSLNSISSVADSAEERRLCPDRVGRGRSEVRR